MTVAEAQPKEAPNVPEMFGRYAIHDAIAQGGMARVHLARLSGPEGFARVVAVKRMHRHVLEDPDLKRMFISEARLAARVQHPNVVPILDVLAAGDELMIVMEYVHGESLQTLLTQLRKKKAGCVPLPIAVALMLAVLHGLHAAHEARDENGQPLDMVHRDVTPHNVLVGTDGVARVLDFGIAKAVQVSEVKPQLIKGKFSYLAPEVIRKESVTRQADVFAASTVLWELLTGRRLFGATSDRERLIRILSGNYPSPRKFNPELPESVESIVMRGLHLETKERYATALEMAIDLERAVRPASQHLIGEWVRVLVSETLNARANLIQQIETSGIVALRPSTSEALGVAEFAPPQASPAQGKRFRRRYWFIAAALGILAAGSVWALWGSGKGPSPSEVAEVAADSRQTPRVDVQAAVHGAELPSEPAPAPVPAASQASEPAQALSAPPPSVRSPLRATESPLRDVRGGPEPSKKRNYAKDFLPDEL